MPREPKFIFRFERALQAAAYLLSQADGELRYIHLLKMLYIADREYLATFGEMITGDRVCAMEYGPVLSCVLNLIKGKDSRSTEWLRYIETDFRKHSVRLVDDPQNGSLCRASRSLLDDVFRRYGHLKPFEVVDLTHEFPEWQEFYRGEGTATPIPWSKILSSQGRADMIPAAIHSIKMHEDHILLAGAAR